MQKNEKTVASYLVRFTKYMGGVSSTHGRDQKYIQTFCR